MERDKELPVPRSAAESKDAGAGYQHSLPGPRVEGGPAAADLEEGGVASDDLSLPGGWVSQAGRYLGQLAALGVEVPRPARPRIPSSASPL